MKRYVAELVGTFVLVFGGCGSAVLAGDKIGFAGVSFAFGLSLLAMVYAIGPMSGCHLNPVVTVGVLLSKKMQPRYAPGYLVAQVIGAMLAAGILLLIAKGGPAPYDPAVAGFAANGYGEHSPGRYNLTAAFLVEVILTAVLVLTVLGATAVEAPVGFAGIPIGFVLVLIHLVGIPVKPRHNFVYPSADVSRPYWFIVTPQFSYGGLSLAEASTCRCMAGLLVKLVSNT
jgi:aquaporin Z